MPKLPHQRSKRLSDIEIVTINLSPIESIRLDAVDLDFTIGDSVNQEFGRSGTLRHSRIELIEKHDSNSSTSRGQRNGKKLALNIKFKHRNEHIWHSQHGSGSHSSEQRNWSGAQPGFVEGTGNVEIKLDLTTDKRLKSRGWSKVKTYCISNDESLLEFSIRAYRIKKDSRDIILLYDRPDASSFMSKLPDETSLCDITFPGTHESCALYGFPVSQCQQGATPISQQLLDDIRLKVVDDELLMYHGVTPQRSSFAKLLATLSEFFASHPGETIILSLKDEVRNIVFSELLYRDMMDDRYSHLWFLEDRIPKLGEVRGKCVVICRFPIFDNDKNWIDGSGIHPYGWGNSRRNGFEFDCSGTQCRFQDWLFEHGTNIRYAVPSFLQIPEKFETAISFFKPSSDVSRRNSRISETSSTISSKHQKPCMTPTTPSTFTLSFTSASSFPLSLPSVMAKGFGFPSWGLGVEGINSRILGWLLALVSEGKVIKGGMVMDFYRQIGSNEGVDDGIREILVLMNEFGEG